MRRQLLLAVSAALTLAAPACDEPSESSSQEREKAAPLAASTGLAGKSWLEVADRTSPELWLASHEMGRDLPPSAAEVASFRELLARAGQGYNESPRMIANRAVQLEAMLAERGIAEDTRLLLEGLVGLGAEGQRRSFGETAEHYFHVRAGGASRAQALARLRKEDRTDQE